MGRQEIYEMHFCSHCQKVDPQGLHGPVYRAVGGKQQRHGMLNDIICRSQRREKIPAQKEPLCLQREDGKRPYGATLITWSHGLYLARQLCNFSSCSHIHPSELAKPPTAQLCLRGRNTPLWLCNVRLGNRRRSEQIRTAVYIGVGMTDNRHNPWTTCFSGFL